MINFFSLSSKLEHFTTLSKTWATEEKTAERKEEVQREEEEAVR